MRGCSRLEKYSVVSEKLEYLNLDGTTIEKLPSLVIGLECSIQLPDCPKFERLPAIVDSLLPITSLCLDNCLNLSELPENLDLLSKLNKLSLRGSNIENLPVSIKHISQLRDLNVSNCRRLHSLPELPFLLQDLNASNCISLETISSSGITMLQDSFDNLKKISLLRQIQEDEKMSIRHRDYLGRFEFYNCIKLDQTACKAIMEEAVIRIQLAACLSSRIGELYDPYYETSEVFENFDPEDIAYISRSVYIILPGTEVLDWFIHKRTDSSIIKIELSALQRIFGKFPGFAVCLVLGPSDSTRKKICRTGFMAGCRCYIDGRHAGGCILKSSCNDAGSNQVWLWYDQIFTVVDETSHLRSAEVSFEFFVRPGSSGFIVKQCGIRPLCAPFDIMQISNGKETSREGTRHYREFEDYKRPMNYALIRNYICLLHNWLDGSIPAYQDRHFVKHNPSINCAKDVIELQLQHNRFGNRAEVIVNLRLDGSRSHYLSRDMRLQCIALARNFQDYYCYFGELVDNINVFSSLRRLSLYDLDVERLAASIKDLPNLEQLAIIGCKRLMSVPKLPSSLRSLSVVECTSLKTVELAKENITIVVYGNVLNKYASIVYEKVSRIQVTDPGTSVKHWFMQWIRPGVCSMTIAFNVASHPNSLNAMS